MSSRRWVVAVCACLSGAAAGQDPSPPYVRLYVPGTDVCLAWKVRDFVYHPDAAGSAQTPGETEFTAIDAAFQTWQAASESCSDFRFIAGERLAGTTMGYDQGAAVNHNVVVFRETACGEVVPPDDPCFAEGDCGNVYRCWNHGDFTIARALTTSVVRTGEIRDADIELNAERYLFTTVSAPPCQPGFERTDCVATDVQNTMTHEIGHALGLDHVAVEGSTMEATAPLGETQKRILDVGTVQGFCAIYPPGLPASSCDGTDSIRIIVTNRGTGCQAAAAAPLAVAASGLVALLRRRRRRR